MGFDLDGVLMRNPFVRCLRPRLLALARSSPALRGLRPEEADRLMETEVENGWQRLMRSGDWVAAYDWDRIYGDALRAFGQRTPFDVAACVRDCCGVEDAIAELPGAQRTLAALQGAGCRLVVVTNGFAAYQEPVLEALGLLGYFDAVITPDRAGYAKPQAGIFQAAGPLDLFVGDTLVHDVLGAKAAGAMAVWLAPELPTELHALDPMARVAHPALRDGVAAALAGSPYSAFHPEATVDACLPDAAVTHLDEVVALAVASA